MSKQNFFIDIDGVLLGHSKQTRLPILAHYADELVSLCLNKFECYWLTTHCKGSAQTAVDYLRPYADAEFITLIEQIKPSNFKTFKTEALFGDFYWLDDQPTAYEIMYLEQNDFLQRWLQVNTRQNINDLKGIIEFIEKL